MKEKIEWIRLNKRHGDISNCASAHKIDEEYIYHVVSGRRNNEEMLDKVIEYIIKKAAVDGRKLYEVKGVEVANYQVQ